MRLIDADAFEQDLKEKLLPLLVEKYGKEEAMKGLHFSLQDCISNIQGQPTITQPDPEWIPCSERMPENEDEVLTTYIVNGNKNERYIETATYYDGDIGYWSSPWDEYRVMGTRVEVIAWMPLPKPYKEGEQDD